MSSCKQTNIKIRKSNQKKKQNNTFARYEDIQKPHPVTDLLIREAKKYLSNTGTTFQCIMTGISDEHQRATLLGSALYILTIAAIINY